MRVSVCTFVCVHMFVNVSNMFVQVYLCANVRREQYVMVSECGLVCECGFGVCVQLCVSACQCMWVYLWMSPVCASVCGRGIRLLQVLA